MNQRDDIRDDEIMGAWYRYAADQPGFVGASLRVLRDRQGPTPQQQQHEFGVNDQMFLRLQAMPLPRPHSFVGDAHRIAETCHLANPLAFVQAMILARNLERTQVQSAIQEMYQAAFDAAEDLDRLPDEE